MKNKSNNSMASEFFEIKSSSNKSNVSKISNKDSKITRKDSKITRKDNKLTNFKDKKQLINNSNGFVEININNKNESKTACKSNKNKTNSQTFN